jgi:hypothetical protein
VPFQLAGFYFSPLGLILEASNIIFDLPDLFGLFLEL